MSPPRVPAAVGDRVRAAAPSFSPAEQRRLSQLNHIAGQRPLRRAEKSEQTQLLAAYHRSVLRRAQALAILTQRGHATPTETKLQSVTWIWPKNNSGN